MRRVKVCTWMLDCCWLDVHKAGRSDGESVMKPIWLLAGHKKVGVQKGREEKCKGEGEGMVVGRGYN
jgi:hypothetical protein